jgi:hypothetical protein
MRRRFWSLGLAALAVSTAAATMPAAHADQVIVAIDNPGGSRTLFVEDLLGQPLTTLDFGTARSQAFRVRIVDSTMDRAGFQVLTSLSNLYLVSGAAYDWTTTLPAGDVAVNYPPNPLNLINPQAVVAPLYDMTETVSGALCTSITTLGGSCTIVMNGVAGLRQTVGLATNLADLTSLPLIPQIGETGAYTSPDFGGIAANDPNKPASFTPTNRKVISGAVNNAASTLTAVTTALQALIAGQPATSLVNATTLETDLRTALGGAVYDGLLPAQVQTILGALNTAAESVTASQIVAQSGTYLSYPKLDATVPAQQTPGSYKGTLVVTAVQL